MNDQKLSPCITELEFAKDEIARLKTQRSELVKENKLYRELALRRPQLERKPTFDDLAHPIPSDFRMHIDKDDIDCSSLSVDQVSMREDGLLVKKSFIPEEFCDRYWQRRLEIEKTAPGFHSWGGNYMALAEMRDICLYPPLVELLEHLSGCPMGLFLTLANVRTTRRLWHQDYYLSPGYINTHYFAVWLAVGDVHPDSGPFEFIRGSHKLPTLRRELIYDYLKPEERQTSAWPQLSERFLAPLVDDAANDFGAEPEKFTAKKGDVLIWHHSLLHQGSLAKDSSLLRPGLIAHYNSTKMLEYTGKELGRDPENGRFFSKRNDWCESFPSDYFNLPR